VCASDFLERVAIGPAARQKVVEHAAEGVDIRGGRDAAGVQAELLGGNEDGVSGVKVGGGVVEACGEVEVDDLG
jgi:hypothetical protein